MIRPSGGARQADGPPRPPGPQTPAEKAKIMLSCRRDCPRILPLHPIFQKSIHHLCIAMSVVSVSKALIVEDDRNLRRTLARIVATRSDSVRAVSTRRDALKVLCDWRPDLLLLDVRLPDGDAIRLLSEASACAPLPRTIAMSALADAPDGFALGQLGVAVFLRKPLSLADVEAAIDKALTMPPDIAPMIRSAVGTLGLKNVETQVRGTMIEEALSRTGGSRRGAARLLDVSRQFLQHALRQP